MVVVASSSLAKIMGECLTTHSLPSLFVLLKWRLAHVHQFHSLGQDKSTVAQRAETTVAKCSLTSCMWVCFRIGSHIMPGQQHSQPSWTSLGVCMFRCYLPPALLAEWPGSLPCHRGNTVVEQTLNKSQHTKLTLEKKILPPLLLGRPPKDTHYAHLWHTRNENHPLQVCWLCGVDPLNLLARGVFTF